MSLWLDVTSRSLKRIKTNILRKKKTKRHSNRLHISKLIYKRAHINYLQVTKQYNTCHTIQPRPAIFGNILLQMHSCPLSPEQSFYNHFPVFWHSFWVCICHCQWQRNFSALRHMYVNGKNLLFYCMHAVNYCGS